MTFLLILVLLTASVVTFSSALSVYLLTGCQLVLLLNHVRSGQVTGTGAFLFMSFLFFGVRAIYIVSENDYFLFERLFRIQVDLAEVNEGVLWATIAMIAFWLGSAFIRHSKQFEFQKRAQQADRLDFIVTSGMARALIAFQVLSIPVIMYLAGAGRNLYGSAFGAYAYDLPVPLQSIHILAILAVLERYRYQRHPNQLFTLALSGILFLIFTWYMREVSVFRGFYIAGVMIAGLAVVMRLKGRVSYLWLILPIVLLQPIFRTLGEVRHFDNDTLREFKLIDNTFGDLGITATYWGFYDGRGDMNILDTFVAARASEPSVTPFALSWLYAPVHFIPRFLWSSKPERGILQDLSFTNGAPYSPGIAGFFWLDGGSDYWMVLCMLILGLLVGYLDGRVLSMKDGYLKYAFLAILAVNCMFLTRFFLWQALWQGLYAVIPCLVLNYLLRPKTIESDASDLEGEKNAETSRQDVFPRFH
ncbi:MAG: hypothetical protein AAGJ81_09450 [Verrucomicrobiota bacterium]